MSTTQQIQVMWASINIFKFKEDDYISLTDMVRNFWDDAMIYSWMRNRSTLQFIGIWE